MTVKNNKELLIESLYCRCQLRIATSKDVFRGLVSDLGLAGTEHIEEKALDIIRPYKNTGVNLESTAESLYSLLYPNTDSKQEMNDFWNNDEP